MLNTPSRFLFHAPSSPSLCSLARSRDRSHSRSRSLTRHASNLHVAKKKQRSCSVDIQPFGERPDIWLLLVRRNDDRRSNAWKFRKAGQNRTQQSVCIDVAVEWEPGMVAVPATAPRGSPMKAKRARARTRELKRVSKVEENVRIEGSEKGLKMDPRLELPPIPVP
eukprot:2963511-Rhodomonas_salina.5